MQRLTRSVYVLLSLVLAAAVISTVMVSPVDAKGNNQKFEFTGVTFPDGTEGTIRAGVKITKKSTTAVASYFTSDEEYLGQYQEVDGFSSTDRDEVLQWALDHYDDRQ